MTEAQYLAKLVTHFQSMEETIVSKKETLLDKLRDELSIVAAESGADRELDYDSERHLEEVLEEAYKQTTKSTNNVS